MNPDSFDHWLQSAAEQNRNENIPSHILKRLPKKVLTQVHEEQKNFRVRLFCLGLTLCFGVFALVVTLKAPSVNVPLKNPVTSGETMPVEIVHTDMATDEDIVNALANLEEERLWQLGPEFYSANMEVMDWVALGR